MFQEIVDTVEFQDEIAMAPQARTKPDQSQWLIKFLEELSHYDQVMMMFHFWLQQFGNMMDFVELFQLGR